MEKIFVTIRVRPLSKVEAAKGSPWKLGSNSIALCGPTGAPVSGQSYVFDKVFGSETSTLEIYETHTKDIIASAVAGFNGTVFAYGQTSSGKTYTMRGSPQEPGIIPLAVQEIFRNIQEAENREFLLRVSYMEIYNEEINDLLAPENRKLQVHENVEKGVFVAGLREEIVVSPEQVLNLMTSGETYRHVGETNMNVYSSRSHSIFRMVIESRDRSHDDPAGPGTVQSCDAVRVSVLNLVDLAGSERVAKTGAEGARLKEGTHINKSLMTLGTVINKLSEGVEKQGGHVPYRDSKLTRILQPALGGNAKTAVICNITPAQIHVDETKGTLFFASRANRVTNCAQVNEIMTDAALLKRQKKEIEELRNKLQENHSDHWDAEILNLRNALLKTELERERMALELQQEKKAQAERERRLKEQEQKIENLSTMVINSAVDDRDLDRRNKKNNRRETWCPRIPSSVPDEKPQENKKPFPKESPLANSMFSMRRERLPPLPPSFENLMESEDTVPPLLELDENALTDEFQSFPSSGSSVESIFQEPPPVFFCERKRRSSEKSVDEELRKQLGELQAQYDDFQLQHEILQHEMREKVLEMKELKEELAFAQSAVNKARKLESGASQSEDRRGKSLDGWESDGNVKQLRAQIQNLELEKIYMQKELDSLKAQSAFQTNSADSDLNALQFELEQTKEDAANAKDNLSVALQQIMDLQQELEESREDAASAKVNLSYALQKISELLQEQQLGLDQQAALAAHFDELTLEVETTKSGSQALFMAAVDSTNALKATLMNLQESIIDVKSVRAAVENQQFGSLQGDLEALLKEHDSLSSNLRTVEKERDAFCEISKQAQAGLKSLEEEIRGKSTELDATVAELLTANKHIVDAGNEIVELQSVLRQREIEQEALEQNIRELQTEALGSISKAHKEKLDERIAELEQELELVSQEKASLICKGDAMQATIQLLEGERDALIETSKQAQADMDRLQGRKRQELKEAQNNLELALSESHRAKEQLLGVRALLIEKTEEQQALQLKLENLQREATTRNRTLEESVRAVEAQLSQKCTELEIARREYGELVASHEALNKEKCEISEVCSRSEEEQNRLCRELDSQGRELAEAVRRLESGRAQRLQDEKQLSELQLALSKQNIEIEALKFKIANLTAEKCAIETCLAGESPESINSVLVEKSVELSNAECSLQSNMAELERIKHELALLQELKVALESELVETKTYSVAVEETLSEAVSALEAKSQEDLTLKADFENALKESELKSSKLADIENECAALVQSMESIKLEMEDAKVTWDQEVQNQKETIEAASIEQLALVEECKALRSALVSLEEEREVLKEQNFQAETELKEFDVEVQRQRQEIEVAGRELEIAKHESTRAAEVTADLREAFSLKNDEIVFLQTQIEAFGAKTSSLEDNLDEKVRELELAQQRVDTLTLELRDAQHRLANLEALLLEKDERIKVLSEDLSSLEADYSGMREDINCKVAEMEQLVQLTSAERALLVEKNDVAVVDLQRVEEERDELLKIIRELKEESAQLRVLLSDEESQSRDAKLKITSFSTHINELQELLEKKNAEIEQLEQEMNGSAAGEVSRREELESEILALQALLSEKTAELEQVQQENSSLIERMTAVEHSLKAESARRIEEVQALVAQKTAELDHVEQEKNSLVERMTAAEQSLREELGRKMQELVTAVSSLQTVNSEIHVKLKESELRLNETIGEKEKASKENEDLLDGTKQLQERISCLEHEGEQHLVELRQLENRLASANSEIDDTGKQLNDVHALLTENQKERLALQQTLEEVEKCKVGLQERLSTKETDLESTAAALSEIKSKFEALLQQHSTELSQLKSDILGLRKELKTAKAAPAHLEKERDGLRKDLEKLKTKLGDVEAKFKLTLVEKSKVETERLNIEREVKQLRQSTALLNKRESIVDKRRESVACGLNKTKQQLSSVEHALQMKTNELEKTAFDLQLLQDNYAKLEADVLETENASVILKEKLADAEIVLSLLRDEKVTTTSTIENITQELEEELGQKRAIIAQLEALRSEHMAMMEKSSTLQVASQKAEAEAKSISLERDDLARQLVDIHMEYDDEKAAWASKIDECNAKVEDLQQQIVTLTEDLQKVQEAQVELAAERDSLHEQLSLQVEEAEQTAVSARVALEEQVSKLEHCLESSAQENTELRQQVDHLNSRVDEQIQLQRKLEEETFVGKEQHKELAEEFEKLKGLAEGSEDAFQNEKQFSMDLAEEIKELKSILQAAEEKCAGLQERNFVFEAVHGKESDERIQLLEDRRALMETVQSQTDRCVALEGQISQLVFDLRESSDNNSRLVQEIQDLKEKLHSNPEVSTQQQESEVSYCALELEVAKNQVERLQSQLKMSNTEIESLQTELDDAGMKVKSLYLEVDDLQAALDQSRTEKFTLKQQLSDMTSRLSSLEDKNEQLQEKETHLLQLNRTYLTSQCKLKVCLNASRGRLEYFTSLCEKMEEAIRELDDQKSAAKKENDDLVLKLQNLRSRCQRYEEELKDSKNRRISPEEEQERETQIAEIMQQNSALQLRLAKADENAKARREEMTKLYEAVQRKEESIAKLEAALEKSQSQVLKPDRELYQRIEPQTARKIDGPTMPSGEFTTPVASRHDDDNPTDDPVTLYSNSLASRSKVEQLKLQSQSLLRMAANKQPWRIPGSPGCSMDETEYHPPPSATLHSQHENLTAPIPTWKRARTSGAAAAANTDANILPFNNASSEDNKLLGSSFNMTRSAPRAALAPVTQNKLQLGLKRRLQETQDKLPVQDEAGTKPSVSSSQMPRNLRFKQRFEKENL